MMWQKQNFPGFKGRLNKYLKRELERVSKQTNHSGLKVPEPEQLEARKILSGQILHICLEHAV